jgi:hypothetical protein
VALYDAFVSIEEAAAYAREEGLSFPIGIVHAGVGGGQSARFPAPGRTPGAEGASFLAYGVRQLPTVLVIDPEGVVRAVNPSAEELSRLPGR